MTRDIISSLLKEKNEDIIDVLGILVKELLVRVLHPYSDPTESELKLAKDNKGNSFQPSFQKQHISLLGSIPLPQFGEDLSDDADRSSKNSGSDVPSSNSSDEQVRPFLAPYCV